MAAVVRALAVLAGLGLAAGCSSGGYDDAAHYEQVRDEVSADGMQAERGSEEWESYVDSVRTGWCEPPEDEVAELAVVTLRREGRAVLEGARVSVSHLCPERVELLDDAEALSDAVSPG